VGAFGGRYALTAKETLQGISDIRGGFTEVDINGKCNHDVVKKPLIGTKYCEKAPDPKPSRTFVNPVNII
jgi:hypothetical protein